MSDFDIMAGRQFGQDECQYLFDQAAVFKNPAPVAERVGTVSLLDAREQLHDLYGGREPIITLAFGEPSTRTDYSFRSAAMRLGMQVMPLTLERSSIQKGESIEHTAEMFSSYSDIVVVRHGQSEFVNRWAEASEVPVINGGDGANQHPSQAALNLFTVQERFGRLDGLNFVFGNDLRYDRAFRSTMEMLAGFSSNQFVLASNTKLKMEEDLREYLIEQKVDFKETENPYIGFAEADVVSWSRRQESRMNQADLANPAYGNLRLNRRAMDAILRPNAIVTHAMPMTPAEIDPVIEGDEKFIASKVQAPNGVPVRMAMLYQTLIAAKGQGRRNVLPVPDRQIAILASA